MYDDEVKQRVGWVPVLDDWQTVAVDWSVGCRRAAGNCPVFHALSNAGFDVQSVNGRTIYFWENGCFCVIRTPYRLFIAISEFDKGHTPAVQAFQINRRTLEMRDV